jgi:archaellum component FlaC
MLGDMNTNTEVLRVMKAGFAEVKKDMAGIKKDVAGIKKDVSGLKTKVGSLKTEIDGLRTEVVNVENRLNAKIETEVENLAQKSQKQFLVIREDIAKIENKTDKIPVRVQSS